jgi:hypothetical protein
MELSGFYRGITSIVPVYYAETPCYAWYIISTVLV